MSLSPDHRYDYAILKFRPDHQEFLDFLISFSDIYTSMSGPGRKVVLLRIPYSRHP